ncbi:hypothetical protein BDV10DRAFT_160406 [Aspergillus recurvatus]
MALLAGGVFVIGEVKLLVVFVKFVHVIFFDVLDLLGGICGLFGWFSWSFGGYVKEFGLVRGILFYVYS